MIDDRRCKLQVQGNCLKYIWIYMNINEMVLIRLAVIVHALMESREFEMVFPQSVDLPT